MIINTLENGVAVTREMTPEEEAEYFAMQPQEQTEGTDALTEMARAMSTASSLAKMREAAQAFLDATGVE